MPVYDINGNPLDCVYDLSGNPLDSAYNIDGELIWASTNTLKVMSFNVGSWYGYAKYIPDNESDYYYSFYQQLFNELDADMVGIQEYCNTMGGAKTATNLLNGLFGNLYAVNRKTNPTKAGRAIASKFALSDTAEINFDAQTGEVRSFLTSTFRFRGKTIYFLTAHLALTATEQEAQIQELLDYVEDKEYWIMTGDFNVRFDSAEASGYSMLIEPFADAGYNIANGADFGFLPTWCGSDSTTDWHCIDNIFTSANIEITNAYTDDTKVTAYINGDFPYGIDHIPLIAELEIH